MKRLLRYEMFVPKTDDRDERAREQGILLFNSHEKYLLADGHYCHVVLINISKFDTDNYQWVVRIFEGGSVTCLWVGRIILTKDFKIATLEAAIESDQTPLPVCRLASPAEMLKLSTRMAREMVVDLQSWEYIAVPVAALYPMAAELQPVLIDTLKQLMTY